VTRCPAAAPAPGPAGYRESVTADGGPACQCPACRTKSPCRNAESLSVVQCLRLKAKQMKPSKNTRCTLAACAAWDAAHLPPAWGAEHWHAPPAPGAELEVAAEHAPAPRGGRHTRSLLRAGRGTLAACSARDAAHLPRAGRRRCAAYLVGNGTRAAGRSVRAGRCTLAACSARDAAHLPGRHWCAAYLVVHGTRAAGSALGVEHAPAQPRTHASCRC
jgi:hypothetical protein